MALAACVSVNFSAGHAILNPSSTIYDWMKELLFCSSVFSSFISFPSLETLLRAINILLRSACKSSLAHENLILTDLIKPLECEQVEAGSPFTSHVSHTEQYCFYTSIIIVFPLSGFQPFSKKYFSGLLQDNFNYIRLVCQMRIKLLFAEVFFKTYNTVHKFYTLYDKSACAAIWIPFISMHYGFRVHSYYYTILKVRMRCSD